MKILFLAPADNAHTYRWVRALIGRGHQIIVLSTVPGVIPGAEVEITLKKSVTFLSLDVGVFATFIQFRRIIKRFKPDIVHIHFIMSHWANCFYFRGIKNLAISVWGQDIVYDGINESTKSRFFKYILLKQAKVICATTNFLRDETKKYLHKRKNINVIPFGVDTDLFKRSIVVKNPINKTIKIGFIKHLLPKYGPEVLLAAFKQVVENCDKKLELIFVGKGFLEDKLKQMAIEFGIKKSVSFLGSFPHCEIVNLYRDLDIFAMPSVYRSETFGVAAIEAQAMEIPVVASRIGGVPEAVQDEITGILVEPGNAEELAEALIRLIINDKLRHDMGVNGRIFVKKYFEWKNNVDDMENIYQTMLNKKSIQ